MKKSEAYSKLRALAKDEAIPQGTHNNHGMQVGTRGLTGTHEHGGVHRNSGIYPRKQGGVMVIVDSELHAPDGDELRFKTKNKAIEHLNSLRDKRPEEFNDIPF